MKEAEIKKAYSILDEAISIVKANRSAIIASIDNRIKKSTTPQNRFNFFVEVIKSTKTARNINCTD